MVYIFLICYCCVMTRGGEAVPSRVKYWYKTLMENFTFCAMNNTLSIFAVDQFSWFKNKEIGPDIQKWKLMTEFLRNVTQRWGLNTFIKEIWISRRYNWLFVRFDPIWYLMNSIYSTNGLTKSISKTNY